MPGDRPPPIRPAQARRGPSLVTIAAIAACAAAAADMIHEAMGHGLVSALLGVRILSLSTVALQTAEQNPWVSAAGTTASLIVGALAFVALGRLKTFGAGALFLWLFGAFCLLNTGYLLWSAISESGDWSAVIYGMEPALPIRIGLGVVGAALYILAAIWTKSALVRFVASGDVSTADVGPLLLASYVAAGVMVTAASALNPIGPSLILGSGVAASFGLNAGLLYTLGLSRAADGDPESRIRFSWVWLLLGVAVAGGFVLVLGPGVRFG